MQKKCFLQTVFLFLNKWVTQVNSPELRLYTGLSAPEVSKVDLYNVTQSKPEKK